MKIYLAARYSFRAEIKGYAKQLETLGFEITSSWLNQRAGADNDMEKPDYKLKKFARRDYDDVARADCVILFTKEPENKRGGHHVEFGIGYALKKRMIVVGKKENIFHYLEEVTHYNTFEELLKVAEENRKHDYLYLG